MLKMSARTSLPLDEVVERAMRYFVREEKLALVELNGHLHGREGAVDIAVSGARIAGGGQVYEAPDVLRAVVGQVMDRYGLAIVYLIVHLHTAPDESVGHLVVRIDTEGGTDVSLESRELDYQAKSFLAVLPR
jgi:hypothetical protein